MEATREEEKRDQELLHGQCQVAGLSPNESGNVDYASV